MKRAGVIIMLVTALVAISGFGYRFLGHQSDDVKPFIPVSISGPPAPDFSLRDIGGNNVSLSDFSGQVVVLNFWATWCPSCRRELPTLQRVHDHFDGEAVKVVTISIDEDRTLLETYIAEGGYSFPVLWDPQRRTANRFGASLFPQSYVIDRAGRLNDIIIGETDWASADKIAYLAQLSTIEY